MEGREDERGGRGERRKKGKGERREGWEKRRAGGKKKGREGRREEMGKERGEAGSEYLVIGAGELTLKVPFNHKITLFLNEGRDSKSLSTQLAEELQVRDSKGRVWITIQIFLEMMQMRISSRRYRPCPESRVRFSEAETLH